MTIVLFDRQTRRTRVIRKVESIKDEAGWVHFYVKNDGPAIQYTRHTITINEVRFEDNE